MSSEQLFDRFKEAPWFTDKMSAFIGGAGNIGSYVGLFISRLGYNIKVCDDDVVDGSNTSGQLYGPDDVGRRKVVALKDIIAQFSNNPKVITLPTRVTESNVDMYLKDPQFPNVIFSCFDNMAARKLLFTSAYELYKTAPTDGLVPLVFIDGRTTAESGFIFCVPLNDEKKVKLYLESLEDDANMPDLPCSFKATTHNGAIIGSYMVAVWLNFVANCFEEDDIRDVPFKITYNLPLLQFETHTTN